MNLADLQFLGFQPLFKGSAIWTATPEPNWTLTAMHGDGDKTVLICRLHLQDKALDWPVAIDDTQGSIALHHAIIRFKTWIALMAPMAPRLEQSLNKIVLDIGQGSIAMVEFNGQQPPDLWITHPNLLNLPERPLHSKPQDNDLATLVQAARIARLYAACDRLNWSHLIKSATLMLQDLDFHIAIQSRTEHLELSETPPIRTWTATMTDPDTQITLAIQDPSGPVLGATRSACRSRHLVIQSSLDLVGLIGIALADHATLERNNSNS